MSKVEKGSMNVYADLGIADAEEMLVKAQLATKIAEIIKLRKLTQIQAAALLGMPQPKEAVLPALKPVSSIIYHHGPSSP